MQNQLVDTTLANPSLLNFMFENHEIRLAASSSDLWVWAAGQDVFAAGGLAWNGRNSIEKLPKEWVKVLKVHTVKGEKDAIFIAEPGIYYILSRSNKPKPLALFRWVFEDVLPSIRANGYFGAFSVAECIRLNDLHIKLVDRLDSGSNAVVEALYPAYVESCRRIRIRPLPIGRFKDNQLEMEGL